MTITIPVEVESSNEDLELVESSLVGNVSPRHSNAHYYSDDDNAEDIPNLSSIRKPSKNVKPNGNFCFTF
jgi:hypothetical protein